MPVCVNADKTGQLAPPLFLTNESHLENYYYCIINKYDSNSLKFVILRLNKIHVNLIEYNIC